jgi:hypothetical protein
VTDYGFRCLQLHLKIGDAGFGLGEGDGHSDKLLAGIRVEILQLPFRQTEVFEIPTGC